MIERIHLSIINALHEYGTLTEAANSLYLTQSALSHQMKNLEEKLGTSLWKKEGRQLRLTQSGELVLHLAQTVLPTINKAEQTLKAYGEGKQGMLRIGVECYPCYTWLSKAIIKFLHRYPDVDVDIVTKFQFSGLNALSNGHIDLLITPDPIKDKSLHYVSLFDYETVLVVNKSNVLADNKIVKPHMLHDQTLFTFPVAVERLDIFAQFLIPANCEVREHKQIESIEIMLQLVGFNRGICVLPKWLAQDYLEALPITLVRLGKNGIQKSLYAGMKKTDKAIYFIESFIELSSLS